MPHYLTNIKRCDGLEARVACAAEKSGQDVRYEDNPMPGYERIASDCGCIVGHEKGRNYSSFWAAWREEDAK